MTEPIIHKVWPNGTEEWRLDGKLHRVDGPAITRPNGHETWWLNGKRHRVDGPAITWPNGTESWYLDGKPVTREDVMGPDEPTRRWSMNDWIECDDPERLAAAAAAGVAVELAGADGGWLRCAFSTAQQFERGIEQGRRYRIPARVVWPPALTVPEGMTPERLRDAAQLVEDGWVDTAVDQINRWADDLAAQIGDKCSECGRAARGDEFAMSGMCQRCLNPTLAAQIDARPPTGAERYLSERMKDDDYAASYIAADARPPAPSAPEVPEVNPMDVREFAVKIADYVATNINADGMSKRGWAIEAVVQAMEEPTASDEARAILGVARPEPVVNAPAPESSPDGEGQVARRSRSEITDDFDEGTRTIREWVRHGSVAGPQLCEELDAWLWYWGGAADGSSPVGSDPLSKVAAERDALAARLAVWPEVPDGHEVVVVPSEVVDAYASGVWVNGECEIMSDAARAAVDRRPKPEPRVERVPWGSHLRGRFVPHEPDEPITRLWNTDGIERYGGEHWEASVCSGPVGIPCDGLVEVLAEDGES